MKMQDGNTCIPLHTVEDVREAQRRGYEIEFKAGTTGRYDLPRDGFDEVSSWIPSSCAEEHARMLDDGSRHGELRAILPANVQPERPRRLTRLAAAFTRLFS